MNFHFQAIRRACCRNEAETQEQQIQEDHMQAYQAHRLPSLTQHASTNKHTNRVSLGHSPPSQLREYKEQHNNRCFIKSMDDRVPPRQQTNHARFSFHKQGVGRNCTHQTQSHTEKILCLSPRLTRISFVNAQKNNTKQSVKVNSPRVTLTLKNSKPESKVQGKRLKTQEEETEYSSKHSQIAFRNHNIAADPLEMIPSLATFRKDTNHFQHRVIFQEQNESFEYNQSFNCREVSARYEIDHSFNNDLLNNARTIQSIGTSTEIKPKFTSRLPSNFCTLQESKKHSILQFTPTSSKRYLKEGFQSNPSEVQDTHSRFRDYHSPLFSAERSVSPPPSLNISPKVQQVSLSPNAQSNLFYGSSVARKFRKSPKVSVLQLNQSQENEENSEAEELRDVIDNNYLQSQYCSHSNSPMISINQTLKNLSEEKEKKTVSFFKFSPEHSRQASNELQLFKQTRAKLQRTNTIQSIESHSSENSCIDIKFMQRMRGRREVSHLV